MKLMIIQTIRITEATERQIALVAREAGESKQTIIRQAIKEGLPIVEQRFLSASAGEKNETNNQINK